MRLERSWRIGLTILAFPFLAIGGAVLTRLLFGDAEWAHHLFVWGVIVSLVLLLRPPRDHEDEKGA